MTRTSLLVVAIALALVACETPIRTEHDSDPQADFGRYRSYAWIGTDPQIRPGTSAQHGGYVSPLDDQRIRAAIDADLAAKGYVRKTSFADADLVVTYSVGTQQKIVTRPTGTGSTSYYPDYGHGNWYGYSTVSVHQYVEGTLAFEVYDRRTKQAVWVGYGHKRLSKSDESDKLIQRVVTAVLAAFPSRTGPAHG